MATPHGKTSSTAVNRAARTLMQRPGWDPRKFVTEDPAHSLRLLDQKSRDQSIYRDADDCDLCSTQRQRSGDATALCERHLKAAMGL